MKEDIFEENEDESFGSKYAGESESPDEEDPEYRDYNLSELLKCNTDGFLMTYSDAKRKGVFDSLDFKNYSDDEIKRAMNNERKKIKNEKKNSMVN